MASELEHRTAIIEIIDFFKFPKATVYSIAKSFKESEDIEEGFLTPKERLQTDPKSGRGAPTSLMFWSKEFWPPSSPDLNPCDYYLWGPCSQHCGLLESCHHPGSGQLVQGIGGSCLWEFRHRVEAVIVKGGSWIE
ncbi:Uncharacterized protein FKW44_021713 [Caligus rogercresseyi]|uniref:Uncharacterized protein n=1 Tax=Caligus rogercresseyi TaxID=217165 RepID=A0A7T8GRQ7_CALRO|nr:Uncharacterized protein FKW44_021713 [Caligus rogercresseyi]